MQMKTAPIMVPTIFWILGIISAKHLQISPILFISFATITYILALTSSRTVKIFIPLIILAIAGFYYSLITILPNNHINNIITNFPSITQPITGTIVSEVSAKNQLYAADLKLSKIGNHDISGKIRFYSKYSNYSYGDQITCVANIKKLPSVSNPGGFDLSEYYSAKSIFGFAFSKSPPQILDNNPTYLTKQIFNARKFIRKRIEQRCGKFSGLIKAILIADKSDIDDERVILSNAGLSHLLAVSGLHVAIIALIINLVFNILLRNRYLSRSLSILTLFCYAAICNFTPSVTRAVIMISLYLISKMIYRKINPLNIIAFSLLLISIIQPQQIFSIGLQMSFAAVITLVIFVPRIKRISLSENTLFNYPIKLLNAILLISFSSLILSIFLAPITIFRFNQFNLNGIFANIIGIPIIAFILGLALIVIFIPDFGFILELYQNSLFLILQIFDSWSKFTSELFLNWKFVSISLWQCILSYICLIFIFYPKSKKFIRLSFSLLLIIIFVGKVGSDKFEVTYFDCDLGDLFLIHSAANLNIMIDTGPAQSSGGHFINSALPYLKAQNISSLDYLIVTHAHNDHYGGLKAVLAELDVKNLLFTDEFMSRKIWRYFSGDIENENATIITVNDTLSFDFGKFQIQIIHPDKDFSDKNKNNMSIVTKVIIDSLSLLFTGDLEEEGEHYLLENYYGFLESDILKVGHHGSKTASSPEFIKAVNPSFAIIPTATKNRFDFPHQITLDNYAFLGEKLFITGKDGAIQIEYQDSRCFISSYKSRKQFILDLD